MDPKIRAIVAVIVAVVAPLGAWAEGSASLGTALGISVAAGLAAVHNWLTESPKKPAEPTARSAEPTKKTP